MFSFACCRFFWRDMDNGRGAVNGCTLATRNDTVYRRSDMYGNSVEYYYRASAIDV